MHSILVVRGLRAACGALAVGGALLAAGCGTEAGGSASSDAEPAVPPEISSQLVVIERMLNGGVVDATASESVYSDAARIHLTGRLAYGSREDFVAETTRRRSSEKIEFGETDVVTMRPDRMRTVTEMTVIRGEDRSNERISHEWVRLGDRWIASEQSYPDWTPLVGEWTRTGDGGETIALRLQPNGQFQRRLRDSAIVTHAGTYLVMGDSMTVVPDAIGVGGTGGGAFDLSHRFEFDGSLRLDAAAASSADAQVFEGVWRRRRLVD